MTETQLRISDLRIGNWVEGEFVTGRERFQIIILRESDDCSGLYPIPLTPALLQEIAMLYTPGKDTFIAFNGSRQGLGMMLKDDKWHLVFNEQVISGITIDYLHQLQNLYVLLTGEEWEINL